MRFILLLISVLFSTGLLAQNDALAKDFFDKGQFEKAIVAYEELFKQNPNNPSFFNNLVISYQELKQFDKAENMILERQKRTRQANLLVELGYNHQLRGDKLKAEEYYKQAFEAVQDNINQAGGIGHTFDKKAYLKKHSKYIIMLPYKMINLTTSIKKLGFIESSEIWK